MLPIASFDCGLPYGQTTAQDDNGAGEPRISQDKSSSHACHSERAFKPHTKKIFGSEESHSAGGIHIEERDSSSQSTSE
jgi:hypothetical protein